MKTPVLIAAVALLLVVVGSIAVWQLSEGESRRSGALGETATDPALFSSQPGGLFATTKWIPDPDDTFTSTMRSIPNVPAGTYFVVANGSIDWNYELADETPISASCSIAAAGIAFGGPVRLRFGSDFDGLHIDPRIHGTVPISIARRVTLSAENTVEFTCRESSSSNDHVRLIMQQPAIHAIRVTDAGP